MALNDNEKFGQKLNCGFQISPSKIGDSVSQNEAPVKHFRSGNFPFRRKQQQQKKNNKI